MEIESECAVCHKTFVPTKHSHICCSKRCQIKRWRADNRDEYNAQQRHWREKNKKPRTAPRAKRLTQVNCTGCGKPCMAGNSRRKFCTPECGRKVYWEKHKTKLLANHLQWTRNNREQTTAHQVRYTHNEMRRHPWHSLIRGTKHRARKNDIPHDIDFEWGKNRWTGHCELTGIAFTTPDKRFSRSNRSFFPSIDRIIPELGYTKNNCRFILWALNTFKGDGTDEIMLQIANALITFNRNIGRTD